MLVVTTPGEGRAEGRGARRRHGAPLVPEGARRRREHDASSSRPTARATRSSDAGGGRRLAALTGAPLVGAVPIEAAVSEGGDDGKPGRARRARRGRGASRSPTIARQIVAELLPPVEMAGCTARMFDLVDSRGRRDARTAHSCSARSPSSTTRTRPAYPDELFDTVMRVRRSRGRATRALEIGAGTGKATRGFVGARSRRARARAEPGHGRTLRRAHGVDVDETTFEEWPLDAGAFRLVFAAQAWHWVGGDGPLRARGRRARAGRDDRAVLEPPAAVRRRAR